MENTVNFQRSSPLRKPIRPRRRPSRVATSTPIANHDATLCDFLNLESFRCTRMPSVGRLDEVIASEDRRFFQCDKSLLLASCHYGKTEGEARTVMKSESKKKVANMRRHVTNVVAKALHLQTVEAGSTRRMSYMRLY